MKKRILSLLLCAVLVLPTILLVGCSGTPSYDKTNLFLEVMEGTFRSAHFEIPVLENVGGGQNGGQNGGQGGGQQGGAQSGPNDKNPGNNMGDEPQPQEPQRPIDPILPDKQKEYNAPLSSNYLADLTAVVDGYLGVNGGVPLTESNKKALAGQALSEGSPFAGTLRALLAVYGDNVFSNNYTVSSMTFSVSGQNGSYAVRGVLYDNDGFRAAFVMSFTEESEGVYSYAFAQYSVNDDPTFPQSTLIVSSYASDAGMMRAELRAKSADVFANYDRAYSSFNVAEFTGASFAMDHYASYDLLDASEEQVKLVMDFARDTLGFTNETYADLRAIKTGKKISSSEESELAAIIATCTYVSPYYYETNDTYVRDSYTVPADVRVIETASIPAARKIYIHGNIEKIESKPFQAPQYVEEIVFIDPTGGKLTEIGSFDAKLGNPSFLLSMTKVKNFTLPASVKKLELGEYILNTEVQCIDLSAYAPAWLDDPSLMTCTYDEFWKEDQSRADFKESAYANLTLCGTESFFYREIRYIHELRMPQFNMGLRFKMHTHLNIISEKYGEYYAEAFKDVYRAFYAYTGDEGSFEGFDEFVSMKGYTRAFASIGRLVYHENTAIVTDEMLFSEFGVGSDEEEQHPGGGKEDEKYKDDKDKVSATHKLFELMLYRDTMEIGHSPEMDRIPSLSYATVRNVILPASLYENFAEEELRQFESLFFELENAGRIQFTSIN